MMLDFHVLRASCHLSTKKVFLPKQTWVGVCERPCPVSEWGSHSLPQCFSPYVGLQPCVGIWMAGVRKLQHAHTWAAGMRFLLSTSIADKALQPDMAFLVAVFSPGMPLQHLVPVPFNMCSVAASLL